MAELKEYKCLNCGAPLHFHAGLQQIECEFCGTTFEVEAIEASVQAEEQGVHDEFDWGEYQNSMSTETMENTVVYKCESCGALLEVDANTVASKCPYCNNNVVMQDRVEGGLKPNAIIPFKIEKKDLKKLITDFYQGKKLIPKGFFSDNRLGTIQGIYVPFWLFTGSVGGEVDFNATTVSSYTDGDYMVTVTSHYLLERAGDVYFTNVPVDASVRMDNDLMDSIEPYDYDEMVPFKSAYLAGFAAERFDTTPEQEMERASTRMFNTTRDAFFRSSGAFGDASVASSNLSAEKPEVKYVLLPVYVLNCEYDGKNYRYAINGQTGKVVGELPVSKKRSFGVFAKSFLIAAAIAFAVLVGAQFAGIL